MFSVDLLLVEYIKQHPSKGHNSVKIASSTIKTSHAYLQYVHSMSAKLEKLTLKTVRGVDYTNYLNYNAKMPNMRKFEMW